MEFNEKDVSLKQASSLYLFVMDCAVLSHGWMDGVDTVPLLLSSILTSPICCVRSMPFIGLSDLLVFIFSHLCPFTWFGSVNIACTYLAKQNNTAYPRHLICSNSRRLRVGKSIVFCDGFPTSPKRPSLSFAGKQQPRSLLQLVCYCTLSGLEELPQFSSQH